MRAKVPCGAGCGRFLPPAGQRCMHIYLTDDPGPVECECTNPNPDQIGECVNCRRRVLPEMRDSA